jgi:two-component system sensor histidine kinase AtoS
MTNHSPSLLSQPVTLNPPELSLLLDTIEEAAFLVINQKIISVNSRASELTAYTRQELSQMQFNDVVTFTNEETDVIEPSNTQYRQKGHLISRSRERIPSYVQIAFDNEQWQIVTVNPIDFAKSIQYTKEKQINILSIILELFATIQIDNPENALSKTLEVGSKLLDSSILAIYVGNEQKPSARRAAYHGKIDYFPSEISTFDLDHFLEPTLWIRGQRSILSFLHQGARLAGLSYLATCPIGDTEALVGVLIAGGYQEPPPDYCLEYLKILEGILSIIIDKNALISNLRKTIQEHNKTIALLESAKNVISDGVVLVNPYFKIEEINQSAEIILGYSTLDIRGVDINDIFLGTDRLNPAVQLALQGITTPNLGNVKLHRRDGSEFPAVISTFPILNKNTVIGVFIILRDKSESEQIRIRTQQLEQRALLGEVTSVFAHEVRNPINNISTGLQLMVEEFDESDPTYEIINRMQQDCNRLTDLMESVLIFSRTGTYSFVPLEIGDLINRLIKLWTPRLNRLNIEKFVTIPPQKVHVLGDRRALEQVFTNLITNAIEAMEQSGSGTLTIKISQHGTKNSHPIAQIDISDTGPGISEENKLRIFEPFFTTKKNGTGLGLAIIKQIVTAHKGSINLTSFPGGTIFHVLIPTITIRETEL